MEILKPYLLLACVAFTIGFVGYWAIGQALAPAHAGSQDGAASTITTSSPDVPLTDGKHI